MRADRLLTIMLLMQVYRKMTAGQLADRLEVSKRTILRDMDALSTAGVPIYAERGKDGGWLLPDGYRTNLTGMDKDEIQTLFLANPAHVLKDLGLDKAAEAATLKLLASLPTTAMRNVEFMQERIHIDGAGWHHTTEYVPCLPIVQKALWEERQLSFSYPKGGEVAERQVHPLGLVAKGKAWYLVADSSGDIRTYRVSRMTGAYVTDERTIRPDRFDLADYWEQSTNRFLASLPRYNTTVRVSATFLQRIRSEHFIQIIAEEADDDKGWTTLLTQFHTLEHAAEFLLGGGNQAIVLEPEELINRIVQSAADISAMYAIH